MSEPTSQQAAAFYRVLRSQIGEIAGGAEVVRQFERDPEHGSEALAEFLRRHALADDQFVAQLTAALSASAQPQFVTEVSGGHVDQIVNIAKLGVLQLTIRRQFFLFRDVRQLVVALASAVLLLAVSGYGYWRSVQPRVMDGEFNIAVAQFGEVTQTGVAPGQMAAELSSALFSFLESELGATDFNLDVQIDHKHIGVITEKEDAEALADRIDADVVIYGTVRPGAATAELDPRFWIREQPETEELTGQNRMGHPIAFTADQIAYADEVNRQMRLRASALLAITKGLVFLKAENAGAAETEFGRARDVYEQAWGCAHREAGVDTFGCEVVYVLLGLAQSASRKAQAAEENLAIALAINPEYARAYIALGNLAYDQAVQQGFDPALLEQAGDYYEQALGARDAPASSFVLPKAQLSLANVYVVQAQLAQDESLYRKAISLYEQVTAGYAAETNPSVQQRLSGVAAVAYFGLGAAYERQYRIDEAIDAYQRCVDLTDSAELRARAQERITAIEAVG